MSGQPSFRIDDKFRALVEHTPDTIVIADENCSIIFCNKNIEKTFGYTYSELNAQSLILLLPPEDRELCKQEVINLVEKKTSKFFNSVVELTGLRKDGIVFPMELSLTYWAEREKVFIAVIIRDVSKRKKTEEDFEKEHAFLKAILENAEEVIIGCDEQGVLNYYNRKAVEKLGLKLGDGIPNLPAQSLKFYFPDVLTRIPPEQNPLLRALNGESIKEEEVISFTPDGNQLIFLVNGQRIVCQDNILRGAVIVLYDITLHRNTMATIEEKNRLLLQSFSNLKSAQLQLKKSNNLLEYRVVSRTKELTSSNKELKISNENLLRANTDLDNFLYIASHDLKVPLINMEALLKLLHLDAGGQNPDVTDLINKLQISVERMKNTMKAISEVAQIQKQFVHKQEYVYLPDLVNEIKDGLAEVISKENAQIQSDFSEVDSIPLSYINLKSILHNLITNAIKYRSAERNPEIFIFTKQDQKNIYLHVKDNGLGIDLAKHGTKLFNMFNRLHNHVDGSGIGLYIIKRIVENYGGTIEVKSTLHEGSEFIVSFIKQQENPENTLITNSGSE